MPGDYWRNAVEPGEGACRCVHARKTTTRRGKGEQERVADTRARVFSIDIVRGIASPTTRVSSRHAFHSCILQFLSFFSRISREQIARNFTRHAESYKTVHRTAQNVRNTYTWKYLHSTFSRSVPLLLSASRSSLHTLHTYSHTRETCPSLSLSLSLCICICLLNSAPCTRKNKSTPSLHFPAPIKQVVAG